MAKCTRYLTYGVNGLWWQMYNRTTKKVFSTPSSPSCLLSQTFARKLVRPFAHISNDDIMNEVRAVNKLCKSNHPNIIQVIQHGQLKRNTAFYFIDMELCDFNLETYAHGDDAGPLESWKIIQSQGRVEVVTLHIMEQILDGLIFVHSQNEVHRDLTPQNGSHLYTYLTLAHFSALFL